MIMWNLLWINTTQKLIITETGKSRAGPQTGLAPTSTRSQGVIANHAHSCTSVRRATPRVTWSLSVSETEQQMIRLVPTPPPVNIGINSHVGDGVAFYSSFSDNWPWPIIQPRLAVWLEGYDLLKKKQLWGIANGFDIPSGISINPLPPNYTNHRSSYDNCITVSSKLQHELDLNRIAGPFQQKPPNIILSPLAAIPKKDPGQIRIIHDLAFSFRQFC